ncbi:unnamed protein product, partial [Tetraodon nigroviridis]
QVRIQVLKDMGITEYEPRVISQMLGFTYISVGGSEAEEPDSPGPHQTAHRTPTSTGPLLLLLTAPGYRLKSTQKKVSSAAGRISVPRLSVGAVSSGPSTPTLG